jgi:hypothetical protein
MMAVRAVVVVVRGVAGWCMFLCSFKLFLSKNPKRRRQRRSSTNPSSINDNDINDLSFSLYLSLSNQQLKYSGGSVGTGVAHTTDHKYDTGTIKLDDERNESESCECLSYATHHPKAPALHLAFGQLPPSS